MVGGDVFLISQSMIKFTFVLCQCFAYEGTSHQEVLGTMYFLIIATTLKKTKNYVNVQ